jgi:hypothetical protein
MLIFRRIFNFEKAKVEQLEKRQNQRYSPDQSFPLQANLHFAGRDYAAKIQDLSSTGIGLVVARDPALVAGHHLHVELTLGPHRLEIESRIAHVKPRENDIYLGLGLIFGEFERQKTYLQLLQPVVIGQSLKPMVADPFIQDDPRYSKQVFIGEADSLLTVRSETTPGNPVHSFEFMMLDVFCRGILRHGTAAPYALESREDAGARPGEPVFETSGGLHEEVGQLFRWTLPNLSPAVPEHIRAFLQRFAG